MKTKKFVDAYCAFAQEAAKRNRGLVGDYDGFVLRLLDSGTGKIRTPEDLKQYGVGREQRPYISRLLGGEDPLVVASDVPVRLRNDSGRLKKNKSGRLVRVSEDDPFSKVDSWEEYNKKSGS